MLLSVEDLRVSFGERPSQYKAVDGVSFVVEKNEIVSIVGESGSGKSVTSLAVMGLLATGAETSGAIRFGDKQLLGLPDREMSLVRGKDISMIFQEPMSSLNPVMTIGEQICEVLVEHENMSWREARAEGIRLLERVRIPAARDRFSSVASEFSGGMRQRVMIAMAIACRPKLLIADEPTTALDVTVQAEILLLLKELQRAEQMSVLLITHDMGVVSEVSDRTIVMRHGKIVEQGATRAVLSAPTEPYTRTLLRAVPVLGTMTGQVQPKRFPKIDDKGEAIECAATNTIQIAPQSDQVLSVKNLVCRFGISSGVLGSVRQRVHAVENVSFDLKRGETLSLVGESGCGKSTIARCITRLVHADSGQILVDGQPFLGLSGAALRDQRHLVQMVFQDPYSSLNPRMKVIDLIAEPLRVHRRAPGRDLKGIVIDLLRQVGLDEWALYRYPREFSGGQRQRLSIARALALKPKLIVADEAVSALDASVKAQVLNLMLDIQESSGTAFLFISHDMAVVERISHRVAVMRLGEIVEIGSRAQIFDRPGHAYTRKLIAATPSIIKGRSIFDNTQSGAASNELSNPLRALDYVPPTRSYEEIEPGHFVQIA